MAAFTSLIKTKPEFGAQKNAIETLRSNYKDVSQAPLAEDYDSNYFSQIANSAGDESKMSSIGKILKSGLQGYSAGKAKSAGQKRALKLEQIQSAIDYQQKVAENAAQQEQDYNVYQQNLMTVQPALASVIGSLPTLDDNGRKEQFGMILNMMGNGLNQDITVHTADSKGNFSAINNATGEPVLGNIYSFAKMDEANPLLADAWKMQTETGRLELSQKRANVQKAQTEAEFARPEAEARIGKLQAEAREKIGAPSASDNVGSSHFSQKYQVEPSDLPGMTIKELPSPASFNTIYKDVAESAHNLSAIDNALKEGKRAEQLSNEIQEWMAKKQNIPVDQASWGLLTRAANTIGAKEFTVPPEIRGKLQEYDKITKKMGANFANTLTGGRLTNYIEKIAQGTQPDIVQEYQARNNNLKSNLEELQNAKNQIVFTSDLFNAGKVPTPTSYQDYQQLFEKATNGAQQSGNSGQMQNGSPNGNLPDVDAELADIERQIQQLKGQSNATQAMPPLPPIR